MKYTVGQKVGFVGTNGEPLDAVILALDATGAHACLKIHGWMGTHWFPVTRIVPQRRPQNDNA